MAKKPKRLPDASRSAQDILAEDYRITFHSETGQRVLQDLKARYGRRSSFDENPHRMAFREGERHVYLDILAFIDKDLKEHD